MCPGPAFGMLTISCSIHRSEMIVFPAGFDSRTCTSRLAFFWDNVSFGRGMFVDISSGIVYNLGVYRACGKLFFIENMHQVHNDDNFLKIQIHELDRGFIWFLFRTASFNLLGHILLCPLALLYHYLSLARKFYVCTE